MKPPPGERPTLNELAGKGPWECPRCGSKLWKVVTTYACAGHVSRQRVCYHCGQETKKTQEHEVPKGFRVVVVPDGDLEAGVA